MRQQGAREYQRLANPVEFFDDAQAVGIAVGNEDAEGKGQRIKHVTQLDGEINRLLTSPLPTLSISLAIRLRFT
jgi:hypothetical protein